MEARREELFGQSAYCSSMPALSPRKRAGHQALAPLLTRPRCEAPGAWMEIEMAALLDFSAADFLGFFASRFDFLRPLAMAASRVGEIECNARPVSAGGSENT
jgi:hypothetical protein